MGARGPKLQPSLFHRKNFIYWASPLRPYPWPLSISETRQTQDGRGCYWSSTAYCFTVSFCFNKPKASSKLMSKSKVNTPVTVFSCHYQALCAPHNGKFCTWNTFKAVCLFTPTASLWGQWRHWAIELCRCSKILQEYCHIYSLSLPNTLR